jgi:hypothetical protein
VTGFVISSTSSRLIEAQSRSRVAAASAFIPLSA